MVSEGESSQPSYSNFGNKLIFISRQRPGHQQAQVYERDLSSGRERRLTFQNGHLSWPRLHPQDRLLLYSSTTDELKENPPILQEPGKARKFPFPYTEPNELYLHNLDTLEMTRLTKRPGFDGEARFAAEGRQISWTRQRLDRTEIATSAVGGQAQLVGRLGKNATQFVTSPDGKVSAWVEWNDDFTASKLKIRRSKDVIEVDADQAALKTDLEISRDSRWLLWAQAKAPGAPLQIWTFDLENPCARPAVVPDNSDRRYPTLSPDLQWLTYTVQKNKKSMIARTTFVQPTGPCRETQ